MQVQWNYPQSNQKPHMWWFIFVQMASIKTLRSYKRLSLNPNAVQSQAGHMPTMMSLCNWQLKTSIPLFYCLFYCLAIAISSIQSTVSSTKHVCVKFICFTSKGLLLAIVLVLLGCGRLQPQKAVQQRGDLKMAAAAAVFSHFVSDYGGGRVARTD